MASKVLLILLPMRKRTLILMVTVAAIAVGIAILPQRHMGQHHLVFKAYFGDVHGLRPGAEIRLAGVRVGSVRSVQAHPEFKAHSAEVVMDIWTENELRVPQDALVSVAQEGVLGDEYVSIDVSGANGETAQTGDTLRTYPTQILTTEQVIKILKEAVEATRTPEQPTKASPSRNNSK